MLGKNLTITADELYDVLHSPPSSPERSGCGQQVPQCAEVVTGVASLCTTISNHAAGNRAYSPSIVLSFNCVMLKALPTVQARTNLHQDFDWITSSPDYEQAMILSQRPPVDISRKRPKLVNETDESASGSGNLFLGPLSKIVQLMTLISANSDRNPQQECRPGWGMLFAKLGFYSWYLSTVVIRLCS